MRGLAAAALSLAMACCSSTPGPSGAPLGENHRLGTQLFSPRYGFGNGTRLEEGAGEILAMGSNILKFEVDANAFASYGLPDNPGIKTLRDFFLLDPSCRAVLEMPFEYYLIWAYPLGHAKSCRDEWTAVEKQREYDEIYGLVRHLLETCNGSGKTFLLGHWEGDWTLLGGYDINAEPDPADVRGMIDWLNLRQSAVDAARRDTPHSNVWVYQYTEVNLVQKGIQGRSCVSNDVLPATSVDLVSYSSYDSLDLSEGLPAMRNRIKSALDHVASKLPAKETDWPWKRVFIGEYGFPLRVVGGSPEKQDAASRAVMRAGLEWGCPFILYWQLYDNEVDRETGGSAGFWLVDDKGKRQPVYHTHRDFLGHMRNWSKGGRRPPEAVAAEALGWFEEREKGEKQ